MSTCSVVSVESKFILKICPVELFDLVRRFDPNKIVENLLHVTVVRKLYSRTSRY